MSFARVDPIRQRSTVVWRIANCAVMAGLVLASSSSGNGQDRVPQSGKPFADDVATTDPLDGFPAQREVAHVTFYDPRSNETVSVGIYPESPQSPVRRPGMYYHRPLFTFKELAEPKDGYPPIVQGEYPQADGSVVLGFRVKLAAAWLRTMCRDRVLIEDRQNALRDAGTEDRVQVSPWPLQGDVIVVCRNKNNDSVLSTKRLPISTREELYIPLRFTSDELRQFKLDLASDQIVFDFYYHYRSVTAARGTLEIRGDKSIAMAVQDVLGSRSGNPIDESAITGRPVFQAEKVIIQRNVQARVERIINAEHPDVLPVLQAQIPLLVDQLLAEQSAEGLSYTVLAEQFGNEPFAAQLAGYLRPQIVQLNETKTTSDLDISIHEDEDSKQEAGGGGLTLVGIGFAQASEESTQRALDRIEKATGVTFAQSKGEVIYRPHRIKVWRVREGWDRVEFNEKTIVYLPIGSERQYLATFGVPTSFTERVAEQAAGETGEVDAFNGIRRGMIVPFFGKELPDGFVWADGKSRWPKDEDWVPEHLRGQPVPNMNGNVVRGVDDLRNVGIKAGSDTVSTETDGAHQHAYDLPQTTGRLVDLQDRKQEWGGLFTGRYDKTYFLQPFTGSDGVADRDGSADWEWMEFPVLYGAAGKAAKGNHAHYLGGRYLTLADDQERREPALETGHVKQETPFVAGGVHSHRVTVVPQHVGVRYVIRVR